VNESACVPPQDKCLPKPQQQQSACTETKNVPKEGAGTQRSTAGVEWQQENSFREWVEAGK